jgi:CheY-like chemotaxis protein
MAQRHRLLVVEDDPGTRYAFRGRFARLGWDVSAARTVAEALAALDAEPEPCCLVLDLILPDGRGETVLERLREKGMRTRVAICTGSTDAARLTAVAGLRPDAMLTKPVGVADVWDGACRVCGGD